MTVKINFSKIDKDLPGLNAQGGRDDVEVHSPLARYFVNSQETPSVPYQVKFPMWFKQNQQQQVLLEVEQCLQALQQQWLRLEIPTDGIVWAHKSALDENFAAIPGQTLDNAWESSRQLSIIWPQISVSVLSSPQNPEAAATLSSGNYHLRLTAGEKEYDIRVPVSQSYGQVDSNREVLQRLALAINSQQSRVKASLEETINPSNASAPYRMPGRSARLSIDGQGYALALQDVSGNLATSYGLNLPRPGSPALYTVDGLAQIGPDNLVSMDDMVGLLREARNGEFAVEVKSGPQPLLNGVISFLQSYNELVDYVALQSDYLRPALKDRLTRPQQDRASLFSEVGLNADQSGRIQPSKDFTSHLLGDYKNTKSLLLAGPQAWAPAFMHQVNQIRQLGLENYASSLVQQTKEQARARAWLELENLREKIISAYY